MQTIKTGKDCLNTGNGEPGAYTQNLFESTSHSEHTPKSLPRSRELSSAHHLRLQTLSTPTVAMEVLDETPVLPDPHLQCTARQKPRTSTTLVVNKPAQNNKDFQTFGRARRKHWSCESNKISNLQTTLCPPIQYLLQLLIPQLSWSNWLDKPALVNEFCTWCFFSSVDPILSLTYERTRIFVSISRISKVSKQHNVDKKSCSWLTPYSRFLQWPYEGLLIIYTRTGTYSIGNTLVSELTSSLHLWRISHRCGRSLRLWGDFSCGMP